jgi:hypothetical protein
MSDGTKRTLVIIFALILGIVSIAPFGRLNRSERAGILAAIATAIVGTVAFMRRETEGELMGIPYSFSPPTVERLKARLWNAEDARVFTPHLFGWGWSINFYQIGKRLGLIS